jgi:glycine/D-amino acid oxidase-like deaminating enzyme
MCKRMLVALLTLAYHHHHALSVGVAGPVPDPTRSLWLEGAELQTYRSTPDLPPIDDVQDTIIIGAGIAGMSAAYGLTVLHGLNATVIDARGVSGGATGRNSGGIGAEFDFAASARQWGTARAAELENNSAAQFQELVDWVGAHCGAHCDLRVRGSVDMYLNRSAFQAAADDVAVATRAGLGANTTVWNASACATRMGSQVGDFAGCVESRFAGTIWASRFAVAVAKQALGTGRLNLQTRTLVTEVRREEVPPAGDAGDGASPSTPPLWEVVTEGRGTMRARRVIFATNAWSSQLLPELTGEIVPVRGQVIASAPVPSQWHGYDMGCDFGDLYGHQQPEGHIVWGGFRRLARDEQVGRFDDNGTDPLISAALLSFLPEHFPALRTLPAAPRASVDSSGGGGGGGGATGSAKKVDASAHPGSGDGFAAAFEWTGLMGFTTDGMPWVGPLPRAQGGGEGAYIVAGFNGGGVQDGWLLGRAVATMIGTGGKTFPPFWRDLAWFYDRYLPANKRGVKS